eukprot:5254057-Pleurochrysis_carterae.AAC.1
MAARALRCPRCSFEAQRPTASTRPIQAASSAPQRHRAQPRAPRATACRHASCASSGHERPIVRRPSRSDIHLTTAPPPGQSQPPVGRMSFHIGAFRPSFHIGAFSTFTTRPCERGTGAVCAAKFTGACVRAHKRRAPIAPAYAYLYELCTIAQAFHMLLELCSSDAADRVAPHHLQNYCPETSSVQLGHNYCSSVLHA